MFPGRSPHARFAYLPDEGENTRTIIGDDTTTRATHYAQMVLAMQAQLLRCYEALDTIATSSNDATQATETLAFCQDLAGATGAEVEQLLDHTQRAEMAPLPEQTTWPAEYGALVLERIGASYRLRDGDARLELARAAQFTRVPGLVFGTGESVWIEPLPNGWRVALHDEAERAE